MVILIPAYEPDTRLLTLVDDLVAAQAGPVVVVDDGSGAAYAHLFAQVPRAGVTLLTHPVNRGKGAALKTGFAHVQAQHPGADVVCADSDGQHSVVDILRVAARLAEGDADMVLGGRRFTGTVPVRSRFGNAMTRQVFTLATGARIHDTQTGLRGHASATLPWLRAIDGDRFEYELRVLLAATRERKRVVEIEIATIYLEGNKSSHFRPLNDSVAIWGQLLAFTASSLTGFALDVAVLAGLYAVTGSLLLSVVTARLVSATANFAINRRFVFAAGRSVPLRVSARRYAALAAVILLANALLMEALMVLAGSLVLAKVITELTLFVASYVVQRTAVFSSRGPAAREAAVRDVAETTLTRTTG